MDYDTGQVEASSSMVEGFSRLRHRIICRRVVVP